MKTLATRLSAGVLVAAAASILLLQPPDTDNYVPEPGEDETVLSGESLDPDSAYFRGEYETAAALYRVMALAGRKRSPGRHAEIGVIRSLIAMGRFDEAERYTRRLDEDSTRTLPEIDTHLLICLRSEIFTRRAEIPLAVAYAADCRQRMRPGLTDDPLVQWYALYVSAFAHAEADQFDVALEYYLDGLNVLESSGHTRSPEYARTINHVANVHYRTGSFPLARRLHEQVLGLRSDLLVENHPAVAASYGNIGNVLHAMGDFDSALEHHLRALSIWTRSLGSEHPQTAYSLNNIGFALNRLERYEEAEYYLLRAAELKTRVLSGGSLSLARTHRNLADAYLGQGNTHLARRYVDRALAAVEESGHQSDVLAAQALVTRAAILQFEGRGPESESVLRTALATAFEQNHPYAVVVLNELARDRLRAGEARLALDYADRAVAFGSGTPGRITRAVTGAGDRDRRPVSLRSSHPVVGESHRIRSIAFLELYRSSGDAAMLESALSGIRSAIDTLDDSPLILSDLTMSGYLRDLLAEFALTGMDVATAAWKCGCIDGAVREALLFANILKNGFDYTETLIREHFAALSDGEESGLLDSLQLELFEARRRRAVLDLEFAATPRRTAAADRRIFDVGRRIRGVRRSIRLTDDRGILEMFDPGAVDYPSIPEDVMVAEYVMRRDRVIVIVLTRTGGSIRESVLTDRLNAMLDTYPEAVRTADLPLFVPQAHGLYEHLVEPLGIDNRVRRLIVSPHLMLWDIPFETLLTRETTPGSDRGAERYDELPYLIEDVAISYSRSAASFLMRSTAGGQGESVPRRRVVAAAPGFDFAHALSDRVREFLSLHGYSHLETDRHTALSGSIQEVRHVTGARDEIAVYTDMDATEFALKKELSEPSNIVHIATHGYASSRSPDFAGILLSPDTGSGDDGILYAEEMRFLPIKTDLITISACYSGYPDGGEYQESRFIHALSSSDIYNLILALWPIQDSSSSDLIRNFYTNVRNHDSVETALRKAKLRSIRSSSASAHPSIWAPFVHVSNNRYGVPVI